MKHANKLWLILAIIAIIGFVVTSCDNGNGNGACTNHTWGTWQNITKQPNCIETGTGTRTCTNCGTVDTNTTIPTNNDHNFADNWLPTGTADWHNDEEDECKQGIETLTCTRTNCNAINGTRIIDPCKGTQSLVIIDGVVKYDPAYKELAVVCIPDKRNGVSVTIIEDFAFYDVSTWQRIETLINVRIGANIITIDYNAFISCINLETVIFAPNSQLQTINSWAFSGCTSLISIEIPASVTSIGGSAFQGCTSLETVTVLATTPPTLGKNWEKFDTFNVCGGGQQCCEGGGIINPTLTSIFVPAVSLEAYKQAEGWSEYAHLIQAIE